METIEMIIQMFRDASFCGNTFRQVECFEALARRVQTLEKKELPDN